MIRSHESPTASIHSRRNGRLTNLAEGSIGQPICAVTGLPGVHRVATGLGATIAILTLVLVTMSCGQDGVEGPDDMDVPDRAVGLLPADWVEFSMFDVARILDSDEAAFADEFEDSWGDALDEGGILIEEVDILAMATAEGSEHVTLLQGSFDLEAIRDQLSDSGMEEGDYRGFELWEGGGFPLASEVAIIEYGGFVLLSGGHARTVLRG